MLKKLKKQDSGFTIIEVMIVLAIAGLIILIVLLAVPALQRNARNTAIKNDASAVAGGITESESNNDGTPPSNVAGTGTVTITNTGSSTTAKVQGSTVVSTVAAAPAAGTPASGNIVVYPKHKCGSTDLATRAFAIYYSVETSSATVQKCLDT